MTYRFNVLLIGSGGREHALARKLNHSESCSKLFAAPGNPGIAEFATCVQMDVLNAEHVVAFCRENEINFVVVGPELPLSNGLADFLRANNIVVFGPSAAAARIESSKVFAKNLMTQHHIPTAAYQRFTSDQVPAAVQYVQQRTLPVVIKADGLAAGKGVVVATSTNEAVTAVEDILGGQFGASGAAIVVEEFLVGEEASLFAITDGTKFVILAPAQDHKRIGNGDTGKNTGGMGAYAPAPLVTSEVQHYATTQIIEPVLRALRETQASFIGCLFAGIMVHADGSSSVVEFNCRFGDPETESVLAVFSGDLCALLYSAAKGDLDTQHIENIANGFACTVVLASAGYPDAYETGQPITLPNELPLGVHIDHAGTSVRNNQLCTAGGRVLAVTGTATTLAKAQEIVYQTVETITFDGKYYRTDIAEKGLKVR